MNIELIAKIVNGNNTEEMKRHLIIGALAMDKNAIPDIMEVLAQERNNNNELIIDFNAELSRAHIYIDERPESKEEGKASFNKNFVIDNIGKFYYKHKELVNHLYNRFL